jgi:hypothetical protein
VLVTFATNVASSSSSAVSSLLGNINSPRNVGAPQPALGLCASPLLGSLCRSTSFGSLKVVDGCATVNLQCTPATLAAKKCVVATGTVGGFIVVRNPTTRAATAFFEGDVQGADGEVVDTADTAAGGARRLLATVQPKNAVFQACCVSPKQREPPKGNAPTCKRINVGKKMNRLKRLSKCKCLNLREFVKAAMWVALFGTVQATVTALHARAQHSLLEESGALAGGCVPRRRQTDQIRAPQ